MHVTPFHCGVGNLHSPGDGPEAPGADLVYHLLAAPLARDVALREVLEELETRRG